MKKLLYNLGKYLSKRFCPHNKTEYLFEDWEERYVSVKCIDCGKQLYKDL